MRFVLSHEKPRFPGQFFKRSNIIIRAEMLVGVAFPDDYLQAWIYLRSLSSARELKQRQAIEPLVLLGPVSPRKRLPHRVA
jgi:hypothetical protein